jgi:integrase
MQDMIADHTCRTTTPWNRGKLIGPKPPLKPKEIWSIRVRLQVAQSIRYLALFNLALDSKLRACDLVALWVDDVALNGRVRSRATVVQRKTGRPVQFEITEQTREACGTLAREEGPAQRRAAVSKPDQSAEFHDDAPVRSPARILASRDWARSLGLRHTFSATDQSLNDLPKDRQSPGGPASARPHQD